jgi:hypothetical protein
VHGRRKPPRGIGSGHERSSIWDDAGLRSQRLGTIFEINGETLTTLYSFDDFPASAYPYAALIQATNGDS